jgi:plastocyanin
MKAVRITAAALGLTAALLAGCSAPSPTHDSMSSSPAPVSGPVQGPAITITALNFGDPIKVRPGVTVTVLNNDDVAHTVTSKAKGQFDVRVEANSRATFTAPTTPGEYPYYCVYHPGMVGALIVRASS